MPNKFSIFGVKMRGIGIFLCFSNLTFIAISVGVVDFCSSTADRRFFAIRFQKNHAIICLRKVNTMMKTKKSISENNFIAEFLSAEWYKPVFNSVRSQLSDLVFNPDFNNFRHNLIRKNILLQYRYNLLMHLPRAIKWQIIDINDDEFANLRVIREVKWIKTLGRNRTLAQAAELIVSGVAIDQGVDFHHISSIRNSIGTYHFKPKIICIAASQEGPRTILDGNHRGVAFQMHKNAANTAYHLPKEIMLGTSSNMDQCIWFNS